MRMGLGYAGIGHTKQKKLSTKQAHAEFKAHFGSSPLVVATVWYDLCHTTIEEAKLSPKERSPSGFKRYLLGHFFIWTYPKNTKLMKSRFNICNRYLEGAELWHWPKKIAALKELKLVWPKELQSSESAIMATTTDAVNFAAWEKKHPTFNINRPYYDEKHNSCGFKYEITLMVYEPKIAKIAGPIRCGKGDKDVFKDEGAEKNLAATPGKLGIADRGYKMKPEEDSGILCLPGDREPGHLSNFKSRARCRHETLNGRLVNFKILQDKFRHGEDRHKIAFEAVAVIVQYQMDNGAPIFDV